MIPSIEPALMQNIFLPANAMQGILRALNLAFANFQKALYCIQSLCMVKKT
jgi:hypothetical protein